MDNKQKEELGKYLLDISKFVFAGIVLIKLLDTNSTEKILVILGGLIATISFLYVGIKLLKQ
ncbi:MAG: DUF6722 family protein [Bacteroidota bacterium]|nr:DUF6722 family protein [Bacteroidota bacterium]